MSEIYWNDSVVQNAPNPASYLLLRCLIPSSKAHLVTNVLRETPNLRSEQVLDAADLQTAWISSLVSRGVPIAATIAVVPQCPEIVISLFNFDSQILSSVSLFLYLYLYIVLKFKSI